MSECRDGARDVSTVRASSRSARVDAARREAYNKSACHNYKSFLFLRTNHPSLARRRITHPSFVSNPLETHPRSLFGRKGEIPKPLRCRFRRPLRAVSRIRDHILARRRVRALDGRTIFSRHHRVVKRLTIRTHVRVEKLALFRDRCFLPLESFALLGDHCLLRLNGLRFYSLDSSTLNFAHKNKLPTSRTILSYQKKVQKVRLEKVLDNLGRCTQRARKNPWLCTTESEAMQ